MSAPNSEKGGRYLRQLDGTLCAGAWADVGEHARKLDKHAPDRVCLTTAARAEAHVAAASHRPTSASSSASQSIHSLGDWIPKLRDAADTERAHPEDAYAARVCLAGIQWLRGEGDEALRVLQKGPAAAAGSTADVSALGWQEVCEVKASFITGAILEEKGADDEARPLYLRAASRSPGSRTAELRRWTERLLARACLFMWRRVDRQSVSSLGDALRCFQAWSEFWQRAPTSAPQSSSHLDHPRRKIWRASYELHSIILQQNLVPSGSWSSTGIVLSVPGEDISPEQLRSARIRQRSAMQQVETAYESLLLNETQFPKASQDNSEVEDWVESVVRNWQALCGPQWNADELGDGGREALSRHVLDVLYRASTKTFHSTAILRQLFNVHVSLGEFDLAMHAFDSYVEIIGKGKTRAEKTGKQEEGLDSDDVAVRTAAEAIRILCQYGGREHAEKASEVVGTLRKWLTQQRPGSSHTVKTAVSDGVTLSTDTTLQPETLAAAYRAIGVCRAHWARVTFDNDSRGRLRSDAINSLRQAQAQGPADLDTSLALALAYADSGDLDAAGQVAKTGVAAAESDADDDTFNAVDCRKERRLAQLWHVLALCSSAEDDYAQAAKMCEAAFEQFGEPHVLFGERGMRASIDTEGGSKPAKGVVDDMEAFEKDSLLQIKMTQISLVEIAEGVEAAVKSSEELLALYTRLFGSPMQPKISVKPPPTATSVAPPSRSGGTLRSLAGSIRPRSRSARRSIEKEHFRPPTSIAEGRPEGAAGRGHDEQTGAPISITVTNEDGVQSEKHHRPLPFKLRHHHDARSLHSTASNEKTDGANGQAFAEGTDSLEKSQPTIPQSNGTAQAAVPDRNLGEMAHNTTTPDAWPAPSGHKDQPPKQDVRLPVQHPASSGDRTRTQMSGSQERQHQVTLLAEVWLFIAGLYLRADHFDDCAGAVDAAFRLAEQFEEAVAAQEGASARRFYEKGWGLGKSVDALWGDVWAAKGTLSLALSASFEAMAHFEQSLSHWPDHPAGVIGLSNLLMDIYEQKLPAEEPEPDILNQAPPSSSNLTGTSGSSLHTESAIPPPPVSAQARNEDGNMASESSRTGTDGDPSPAQLNRLATRDRAYMLLSTLTKLGDGVDNAEAWLALARSHELSGQLERAKKALWWVVRLEEGRGVRGWDCLRR